MLLCTLFAVEHVCVISYLPTSLDYSMFSNVLFVVPHIDASPECVLLPFCASIG